MERDHFGMPDDAVHCKTEGMMNIVDKKCKCGKALFSSMPDDKRPTCCASCKTEGMIDIVNKKCKCGNRLWHARFRHLCKLQNRI